jgi:hypothetical protein
MGMMLRVLPTFLALATAGVHAQNSQPLDGIWRFTMQVPDVPFPHYGEVVLKGGAGTWKIFARKAKQMMNIPCIGRVFPLRVLPSEPEFALTFKVEESQILRGCSDVKVALHEVTANRLEGTTGLGYPITLERD